ncbi:hypothetical protein D187_000976 [Cystobacter fuscus DSM 2262]|uniref:Uncharacterized protein n=1 Tax=Cystobacter fuscus (strain ATCC 25194 / DSM 2262 / NBRC 100088 / M29) TaxID=1242864 RepID=S9QWZ4_CYSF2|nr:hypothetical protein D187_000976 [Cystobacter fuscus DSM 2262]
MRSHWPAERLMAAWSMVGQFLDHMLYYYNNGWVKLIA